jgi:hypothetical protein
MLSNLMHVVVMAVCFRTIQSSGTSAHLDCITIQRMRIYIEFVVLFIQVTTSNFPNTDIGRVQWCLFTLIQLLKKIHRRHFMGMCWLSFIKKCVDSYVILTQNLEYLLRL